MSVCVFFFFFFQAEDGIRDLYVTGVQTCALPILATGPSPAGPATGRSPARWPAARRRTGSRSATAGPWSRSTTSGRPRRSEERRVGKECRSRGAPEQEKKKKVRERGRA